MIVEWRYQGDRIRFEMKAPTRGWVAIGFNKSTNITGTYLIMGHIVNQLPNVVEHYTVSPGDYKPIVALGGQHQIEDLSGNQSGSNTTLIFSLPIKATNNYQRDLDKGTKYTLLMAFSREDDFQHHSMMRTSVNITL